jgi:ribonuclease III
MAASLPANVVKGWLQKYGVNDASVSDAVVSRLQQAFVHRSSKAAHRRARPSSTETCNERLEFLGDSVLALSTAAYVFQRFAGQNEGFLTRMRTKLVNGHAVAMYARHMGLGNWIRMSADTSQRCGRDNQAILEDAFEAWLGALFVAYGFDVAHRWLVAFLETHVDFAELVQQRLEKDHKDQLIKHFQAAHRCMPEFQTEVAKDAATVRIVDKRGVVVASARSTSVKDAESMACRKALKYLGLYSG